jgi:hypothetical protein
VISIVFFLRDQSIVAAQPRDDFVVPPIQFVHFRALPVERCDGFFVVVR